MQHFLSRFSIKAHSTKAIVASVIAVIVCSNVVLARGLANNGDMARRRPDSEGSINQVDNRLTAATSRFSFRLYDQILKRRAGNNTFIRPRA